jgi:hypothetical protein
MVAPLHIGGSIRTPSHDSEAPKGPYKIKGVGLKLLHLHHANLGLHRPSRSADPWAAASTIRYSYPMLTFVSPMHRQECIAEALLIKVEDLFPTADRTLRPLPSIWQERAMKEWI